MDRAVVEVSPAGRACVGSGLLLFLGALVLVGFNETSIAQAHGQLFSITQAAQHVPCDATAKSVAQLGKSAGAQPVFLSCPVTEVADLAKNPHLSVFAPLLGTAPGLQVKVDTKVLQWEEQASAECAEESLVDIGSHRTMKRRGLERTLYESPDTDKATRAQAAGDESSLRPEAKCEYTYAMIWRDGAVPAAAFGCAPAKLLGLDAATCQARCKVPGGGPSSCADGVVNKGHVADGLTSRTVRPADGDVVVGSGYQVTRNFWDASQAEWDPALGRQVNGKALPKLSLVKSVGVEELKKQLTEGGQNIEGNVEVDQDKATLFISQATRGETVGDVRATLSARLLPKGSVVSVLAAMSKDGDTVRLVPWETGLAKPVDKIAWVDFAQTTLDTMVAERIFSLNGVHPLASWMMRVSGWAMVYVGLVMVFWPLSVAPEILPCIGRCVAAADAASLLALSALLALVSALSVTSLCWLFSGLTVHGLWLLGGALVCAIPTVLFCTCLVPKERSCKRASYLEGNISISALKQSSSLGRGSSAR